MSPAQIDQIKIHSASAHNENKLWIYDIPQFRQRSNKLRLPNTFFLISWVRGSFSKFSRRYEDLVIVFSVSSMSPAQIDQIKIHSASAHNENKLWIYDIPQFRQRSNKLRLPNTFFLISWVRGSFSKFSRRYEDLVIVFSVSSISPPPIDHNKIHSASAHDEIGMN